jgi:hypothetical protein
MVEAVRTTASTAAIWAIIAVAMLCLAFWLTAVLVANNLQARESRRRRELLDAPGPALSGTGVPASAVPGQRSDSGQPEPEPEAVTAWGRHAKPGAGYVTADNVEPSSPATSGPGTNSPETGGQADAPTRPDLPAQQPAQSGRHAMPTQRTGDSDRAQRSFAGPDATAEEDPGQA